MIHGVRARAIARFTSVCRVALGAGLIAAPERFTRAWIGDDAASAGAAVLARSLGARDVAIGAGALAASGSDDLERWLRAAVAADVADLGVTLAHRSALPPRGRLLVMGLAASGAALGVAALAGLAREARPAELV